MLRLLMVGDHRARLCPTGEIATDADLSPQAPTWAALTKSQILGWRLGLCVVTAKLLNCC